MKGIDYFGRPIIEDSMLVAAFTGTGKSFYCQMFFGEMQNINAFEIDSNLRVCSDSDSSKFDKSHFPANYIEHIKEKINEGYWRIFISSHKEVRDALVLNQLPFVLIYPSKELKSDYIDRYKERGSSEKFIKLISDNWDSWLDELKNQKGCYHIELKKGQYISNVV